MFFGSRRNRWIKSLPKRFSTSVMILESADGKVLVVRSNYKPYWTLPGGVIDPGETPQASAIRETLEEVGIVIDPIDVAFVAVIDRRSKFAETYQFVFRSAISEEQKAHITLQQSEIQEYDFVSKEQVAHGDRPYAKALSHWLNGTMGYIEQSFEGED